MTARTTTSRPLLCVAVTDESGADPVRIAALIAAQQLEKVLVAYPQALSQRAIDALLALDVAAEPLFAGDTSLGDYWARLAARFAQSDRDVLVLDALSTAPPVCWQRFVPVAVDDRCVVFPHSVRGEASTIFGSAAHEPGLSAEQLDHWLNRYASGRLVDLPAAAGFSGLLRNPGQDAPIRYLLNDAVFVDDRVRDPLPLPEALPLAYRDALRLRHPDTALRHAMTELSERGEAPPADLLPVQPVRLHVAHGWGGGLQHWVDDFAEADRGARSLLLKPIGDRSAFGQTVALYEAGRSQPLLWRTLAMPIISTDVTHDEYRAFLAEIIETFGVTAVFVSSLIGHSLDLLHTGLPTVLVVHNFYPACPAILATFDGPCDSCSPARMEDCFARNPVQSFFKVEAPARWHAVRAAFAERLRSGVLHVVAPTASTRQRLAQLSGVDADLLGVVVPHGLRPDKVRSLAACREHPPRGGERLLVVVVGGQEAHKGGALLERIAPGLVDRVDFLVLGFGETPAALGRADNVTVVESFDAKALPVLLQQQRPDLGLLLSTVPETFSYTLSELQCAGIPTIATDLGAFRDRIVHAETGWRVAPTEEGVCAQILALDADRSGIARVREHLLQQTPRTTRDMVSDYFELLPSPARVPAGRPRVAAPPSAEAQGALLIDPGARFADVCASFYRYTLRKALHSPRVPGPIRSLLRSLTAGRRGTAGES